MSLSIVTTICLGQNVTLVLFKPTPLKKIYVFFKKLAVNAPLHNFTSSDLYIMMEIRAFTYQIKDFIENNEYNTVMTIIKYQPVNIESQTQIFKLLDLCYNLTIQNNNLTIQNKKDQITSIDNKVLLMIQNLISLGVINSVSFFGQIQKYFNFQIFNGTIEGFTNSFNQSSQNNISIIDFQPCEDKLRDFTGISKFFPFIYSKFERSPELNLNSSLLSSVRVSIYSPLGNYQMFNLDICKETFVLTSIYSSKIMINSTSIKSFKSNDIDVFSNKDPFFINKCQKSLMKNSTDYIPLQFRINNYFNPIKPNCYTTNKNCSVKILYPNYITCNCSVENNFFVTSNTLISKYPIPDNSSFGLITCFQNFTQNINHNIGFYFSFGVVILFYTLSLVSFICRENYIIRYRDKIIKNEMFNEDLDKLINSQIKKEKEDFSAKIIIPKDSGLPKNEQNIPVAKSTFDNNFFVFRRRSKDLTNINTVKLKNLNIENNDKLSSNDKLYFFKNSSKRESKLSIFDSLKKVNSISYLKNNQEIHENIERDLNPLNHIKEESSDRISNHKIHLKSFYTFRDIESMNSYDQLRLDDRGFCQYFNDQVMIENIFLRTFFFKTIKISLFLRLLQFANYLLVNVSTICILYNEADLNSLDSFYSFNSNGFSYTLIFPCLMAILFSNLINSILSILLYPTRNILIELNNSFKYNSAKLIIDAYRKYLISKVLGYLTFLIISTSLNLVLCYYITVFYSVYGDLFNFSLVKSGITLIFDILIVDTFTPLFWSMLRIPLKRFHFLRYILN